MVCRRLRGLERPPEASSSQNWPSGPRHTPQDLDSQWDFPRFVLLRWGYDQDKPIPHRFQTPLSRVGTQVHENSGQLGSFPIQLGVYLNAPGQCRFSIPSDAGNKACTQVYEWYQTFGTLPQGRRAWVRGVQSNASFVLLVESNAWFVHAPMLNRGLILQGKACDYLIAFPFFIYLILKESELVCVPLWRKLTGIVSRGYGHPFSVKTHNANHASTITYKSS